MSSMFIFWLICFIICIVELYYIRTAKLKIKTRKDVYTRWSSANWEYTDKHLTMPRFCFWLWLISSLIPFINIITIIISLFYIISYSCVPEDSTGYSLTIYNLYPSGKLFDWLFEEI